MRKLKVDAKLCRVALEAPLASIRESAVRGVARWLEQDPQAISRHDALARITDQSLLHDLFKSTWSEIVRAQIATFMRDPAHAYELARSTKDPGVCDFVVRHLADKALALEIMGQTLNKQVCAACAELADIRDVTDERRLAILALCGPECVRQEAGSRLADEESYAGIALHEGVTRFSIDAIRNFTHQNCLCGEAYGRLSDTAKQRLRLVDSMWGGKPWNYLLQQWTDATFLLDMITLNPKRYCTFSVCSWLFAWDKGWVQKLDDQTFIALIDIISSHSAKYDYWSGMGSLGERQARLLLLDINDENFLFAAKALTGYPEWDALYTEAMADDLIAIMLRGSRVDAVTAMKLLKALFHRGRFQDKIKPYDGRVIREENFHLTGSGDDQWVYGEAELIFEL